MDSDTVDILIRSYLLYAGIPVVAVGLLYIVYKTFSK